MGRHRIAPPALILLLAIAGCSGTADEAAPSADASTLAEPEPVAAPADFFAVSAAQVAGGAPGTIELDPHQAWLLGPHSGFAIERVATVTVVESRETVQLQVGEPTAVAPPRQVPDPDAAEPGWRAADGYEFLVLRTGQLDDVYLDRLLGPKDAEIEATIEAGDHTYKLDPRSVHAETLKEGGATLVMSVAEGADVELVLTDSGRTQSLDLRTGERGDEDAPRLLYTVLGGWIGGEFVAAAQPAGLPVNLVPAEIEGALAGLGLRAYLPELGWAEPGRAWLRVSLDNEAWALDGAEHGFSLITLDTTASFTLAEPGGATIQAEPGELKLFGPVRVSDPSGAFIGGPVVFDVPADLRSGTIRFAPHGAIETAVPGEGTVSSITSSDPMEFELTEASR